MTDYLTLGSVPYNENCVQVGDPEYYDKTKKETERYIEQLKARFPEYQEIGVRFVVKSFEHDFGTYHEVVVKFNDSNDIQCAFADFVDQNLPGNWNDKEVLIFG